MPEQHLQESDVAVIRGILDRRRIAYDMLNPDEAGGSGDDAASILRVMEGKGPKNTGYTEFFTDLEFAADGALLRWGAWE